MSKTGYYLDPRNRGIWVKIRGSAETSSTIEAADFKIPRIRARKRFFVRGIGNSAKPISADPRNFTKQHEGIKHQLYENLRQTFSG